MAGEMDSSARRSSIQVPPVAGVKRAAPTPSLLPAFELYSSPLLPRPAKRIARDSPDRGALPSCLPGKSIDGAFKYPTPIPTSSTGIFSSSPPPLPPTRRPGLTRSVSGLSERLPLKSVPTIELDAAGEATLMGRSGKSSHYQLSTNKLISRVHVQAVYTAANPPNPARVRVECTGWNGAKIHCRGKTWDLAKGDSFTSETRDADIMIDVQDARVLLQWPRIKVGTPSDSESGHDHENSPRRGATEVVRRSPYSSPLRQRVRLHSPVSPSPAVVVANPISAAALLGPLDPPVVKIYEDHASDDEHRRLDFAATQLTQSTQCLTQPLGANLQLPQSFDEHDYSDQDEENDPVIHSFGPFGHNILPRMARFSAADSPALQRGPAAFSDALISSPPGHHSRPTSPAEFDAPSEETARSIVNHVVNQLAYSRLSSTPLSTIMGNLPAELKTASVEEGSTRSLSSRALKRLIHATRCLGEVRREGKDAAGKTLESEFYYIPDLDDDEPRRSAVVEGLKKPGLRACRKQHKQYYWRKPK